ncbi:hypothetical protein CP533_0528 [Ophiocordyceps camponoti-saundersi (nom. inval.)]|nr:hypothetical protein CP533_0528 [Ophiocordyceps camponoti-saundersi (nom. inval.)]
MVATVKDVSEGWRTLSDGQRTGDEAHSTVKAATAREMDVVRAVRMIRTDGVEATEATRHETGKSETGTLEIGLQMMNVTAATMGEEKMKVIVGETLSRDGDNRHARTIRRNDGRRHRSADVKRGSDDEAAADARFRRQKERRAPLASQEESFALEKSDGGDTQVKERPNWTNTGALAAASNSVVQADGSSTTLKYHEPVEARKPPPRDIWKLFVFKDTEIVDEVPLSLKSCWLIGRDENVADIHAGHPSISKQHAVIQFRYTEKRNEYGDKVGRTKPYLLDLESNNGTVLNDHAVPHSRYLELRSKDMILFGNSTRQYIVMLAPRD